MNIFVHRFLLCSAKTEQTQNILIKQKDFQGDKKLFAKEIILWGRKSGTNLTRVEFLPETSIV